MVDDLVPTMVDMAANKLVQSGGKDDQLMVVGEVGTLKVEGVVGSCTQGAGTNI